MEECSGWTDLRDGDGLHLGQGRGKAEDLEHLAPGGRLPLWAHVL